MTCTVYNRRGGKELRNEFTERKVDKEGEKKGGRLILSQLLRYC